LGARPVDLERLKRFVSEELPRDWILRDIVLRERDIVSATEFCAKSEIWLALLAKEGSGEPR
jgi:hypothetical protein